MLKPRTTNAEYLSRFLRARGVIILSFGERDDYSVASFGVTHQDSMDMRDLADRLKIEIDVGELVWREDRIDK